SSRALCFFFFSSRRRHTRFSRDWSSDVCSSDLRIPSTQALRALESFARHGTVWQAADELHLTRSAVSHQLRLLERDLGFRLMNQIGRASCRERGWGAVVAATERKYT